MKSRKEMDSANVCLRRSFIILFVICFIFILHWK